VTFTAATPLSFEPSGPIHDGNGVLTANSS
jgi:hypothetical protein